MGARTHLAKVGIVFCVDDLLHEPVDRFVKEVGHAYVIRIPGAARLLADPTIGQLMIQQLIKPLTGLTLDEVWLINHTDCGACANELAACGQDELHYHADKLVEAKRLIEAEGIKVRAIDLYDVQTEQMAKLPQTVSV